MISTVFYAIGLICIFASAIPILADFKVRNAMITFALSFIFGIWFIAHGGGEEQKEKMQKITQIIDGPKKWLRQEMSDVPNISLDGMVLLIDKKVVQLKKFAENTDDKQRVMIIGNAIGALEREAECLRQMRSPAKCFKENEGK